jgi:hypothetical protein
MEFLGFCSEPVLLVVAMDVRLMAVYGENGIGYAEVKMSVRSEDSR